MLNALAIGKLLIYSSPAVLLAIFLPVAATLGQQGELTVEIVSKHYSSGYLPVTGSYVEYEFRLANTGAHAIENQSLRVSLVSESSTTHSAHSVQLLGPGESKTLHLGPFKMENEGEQRLLAEMDGVALGYKPDSFNVYRSEAVQVALIAIPLMAAGAGITGFSLYRKRRPV